MPSSPGGIPSDLPSAPAGELPSGAPGGSPSPPTEESSGVGMYLAIGTAVIAVGGLLYYTTTRLPARSLPPRMPSRQRSRRASRRPGTSSAAMVQAMPVQAAPEDASELELEE